MTISIHAKLIKLDRQTHIDISRMITRKKLQIIISKSGLKIKLIKSLTL